MLEPCGPGESNGGIYVDTPQVRFVYDYSYDAVMRSFDECLKLCQDTLMLKASKPVTGGRLSRFLSNRLPLSGPDDLAKILDQVRGDTYTKVFEECKKLINEKVQVLPGIQDTHTIITFKAFGSS